MNKRLNSIVVIAVKLIYCNGLFLLFTLHADAQEMTYKVFTAKDGLPSTNVGSTYQDKLGYLWVNSNEGFCRFDGKSFTYNDLSEGLTEGRSALVFVDSHLRYWVSTASGYVEYKKNKFISYPNPDSGRITWNFKIMETEAGAIWSLTSAGVYQLHTNKWIKIKFYPGYDDRACRNIIETRNGLYINYGDLLVLKKPGGTYKIIGSLKDVGYYYNSLTLSGDQIFISTLDGIYEIVNEQLVKLPGPLGRLKGVYAYFYDSKKRFWIGSFPLGLQIIPNGDTTNLITVYKDITGSHINYINEDNQENIWISTGNGLIKIYEKSFKNFDLPSIIGDTILRNVIQPPNGPLFINDGSFTLRTFENGTFIKKTLTNKGSTSLPNNELIIDNYAFDDKGRYWYYIRGFTTVIQDGNKMYEQSKQLSHLGDEVFDIEFDHYRKKILLAVRTQKYPCQFNDPSFGLLPVTGNIEIKGNIRKLHQCTNGTLLFSTDKGTIYSIDKQNNCKQQLFEYGTHGRIGWFYNDPSGDVWIIYYGRGLRRYTWQKDSLIFKEQLTKANGLSSNNVSFMCFDVNNDLWACTNSTVAVFSNKKNIDAINESYQLISFFNSEDLQTGGGFDARLTKDNDGKIWYFSDRYLIRFYANIINYNRPVPAIEIENVELNLRQTNWADYADSLTGIFQLPYHLKLTHDNNTIGIYFKGISTSGTADIKYSYSLEGLDSSWSLSSANDFVSFVKLPPGKYNFKVKAKLPNTNWSKPALFSFEIKKAYWQTIWFSILMGFLISAAVYLLFRYQLKQKINMLEMRNRISQDLHDEIGASISGINLLSQIAEEKLLQNKTSEASQYLEKVKNYTQDVMEKLADMVWIFNPANDSIDKLQQRLKSFSIVIASSKNIQMHFEMGKENEIKKLSIQQRKAIYLVSKEAINNSFKYAACSNIYYNLTVQNFAWHLCIKDDGNGFLVSKNEDGNGLKNMQARASEIGAMLFIESYPAMGTTITMKL